MTVVRFATTCDRCHERSEEYTAWPYCRDCLEDICPDCAEPGSLIEADLDQPATVQCRRCLREVTGDGMCVP